jgi:hypothetical protein
MWITILTIVLFIGIVGGVVYSLMMEAEITSAWKEILLLLLGAFIGAYGKVIDFWFNNTEADTELMRQSSGGVNSPYHTKWDTHHTDAYSSPNQPTVIVNCNDVTKSNPNEP